MRERKEEEEGGRGRRVSGRMGRGRRVSGRSSYLVALLREECIQLII